MKTWMAAAPCWMATGCKHVLHSQTQLPKTQAPEMTAGLHAITGKENKASAHCLHFILKS